MSVCVDKLKDTFVGYLEDKYNQDMYFVAPCHKFTTKYGAHGAMLDLSLRIFFEENNKIILAGKMMKYCNKDGGKRKIKLVDISDEINTPDININNYILNDKWEKTDW